MSEHVDRTELHEPPVTIYRCAGPEWVVVHRDGYDHAMFGGRFYIPPESTVIAMFRRNNWTPESWQRLRDSLERARGSK